jgi:hypothetical protein
MSKAKFDGDGSTTGIVVAGSWPWAPGEPKIVAMKPMRPGSIRMLKPDYEKDRDYIRMLKPSPRDGNAP